MITNRATRHVQWFVIPFEELSAALGRSLPLVTLSEAVLNEVLSKGICGKFAACGTSAQILDVAYVTRHSPDVTPERVRARNEMKAH